jgi:hypothetical protein
MAIEYIRLNKGSTVAVGSDVRCVSGKVVSTRVSSPTQDREVEFRFEWATHAEVVTLYTAMKNGTAVSMQGESVIIAIDGITGVKNHGFGDQFDPGDLIGYDTDLWTGNIKGYVKA